MYIYTYTNIIVANRFLIATLIIMLNLQKAERFCCAICLRFLLSCVYCYVSFCNFSNYAQILLIQSFYSIFDDL